MEQGTRRHSLRFNSKYRGKPIEQIPKIFADNQRLVSIAEIVEARVNQKDNEDWSDFNSYSGDAIMYGPHNQIKLVLDAQPLKEINHDSILIDGALALPPRMFGDLEGLLYSRFNCPSNYRYDNIEKAKSDQLLKYLLKSDNLLNKYVNMMFEIKEKGAFAFSLALDIVHTEHNEVITMRPLEIYIMSCLNIIDDKVNLGKANHSCVTLGIG